MTTDYTTNFQLALPDFRMGPWHDLINGNLKKIDTLLFNALSGANVEVWIHSTQYHLGDNTLDDTDATIWLCVVAHTSAATGTFAADRAAHPTYWTRLLTGFAPRGEWKQNTNYFPYDLAYDSARGIMALCTFRHTSTATGSIVDDQANWVFLLDMSDVGQMIASAVTYSNLASGIPKSDVQGAIDYVETQVHSLDAVNVTQGNQIAAIQTVNTTQDSRLAAVESKNTSTAPHFTATDYVATQFGGSAAIGFYNDGSNVAVRTPGAGGIYFQSQGGGSSYGNITSAGMSITGTLGVCGVLTAAALNAGTINATGGGIYVGGWGGNGNLSVIFLNTAQSHYMYHDGTNVSFAGVGAVYAGNGRLWGSGDFAAPNLAPYVSNGRLVFAGDRVAQFDVGIQEPWGGSVVSGYSAIPVAEINYRALVTTFRHRYVQLYTTGWFTIGYA
jgi:hypothetical protein